MSKFALRFVGIVFFAFLLGGCSIIDNATRYKTGLILQVLNEDYTRRYWASEGSEPALYLPASRKFAHLEYDSGDNYTPHAYTTKKTLSQWDDIFQRFIDWKPGPNEVITLTDPVSIRKTYNPLKMDQDLKFMQIRGKKYLVFTSYEFFPFRDRILAYDEKNVILMKEFFKSLNYVLVD